MLVVDRERVGSVACLTCLPNARTHLRLVFDAPPTASVVVVGNGPSLLNGSHGARIDAHDVVVRFNDYVTSEAYAVHTGNRTTHWVTGLGTQQVRTASRAPVNIVWSAEHWLVVAVKRAVMLTDVEVYSQLGDGWLRTNRTTAATALSTATVRHEWGLLRTPSTGVAWVSLAMAYFSRPVSVVGFDLHPGADATLDHYTGRATRTHGAHDFAGERRVLDEAMRTGRLVLLL